MGITNLDTINVTTSRAKVGAAVPGTPMAYYGFTASHDVGETGWQGGELFYNTVDGLLYIQTAITGTGAGTWYKTNDTFVTTSTTSSSSTTSSTTSSSSSTSSTTSTSTSTSSSTSTSTSTSSTTTA